MEINTHINKLQINKYRMINFVFLLFFTYVLYIHLFICAFFFFLHLFVNVNIYLFLILSDLPFHTIQVSHVVWF